MAEIAEAAMYGIFEKDNNLRRHPFAGKKSVPGFERTDNKVKYMIITQIEEMSKSRARVYIDEEYAFVLYKSELRSFHIREGGDISQADYQSIMEEILPKRAKLRAMNLLKTREYTVKQLHDKLRLGGYPEKIIEQTLDYVGSFHYTDDLRYAMNFISSYGGSRSRRRIEQDLATRGIDKSTLEQAWAVWEEEGGCQDEMAMILALLEKKGFNLENADQKQRQKVYGFLMRKGFAADLVRRAVLSGRDDFGGYSVFFVQIAQQITHCHRKNFAKYDAST